MTGPRLLITGSRSWTDTDTLTTALDQAWRDLGAHPGTVLVCGACPTGVDAIAAAAWRAWGRPVQECPADWARAGRAAGPARNQVMVDAGADLCLAFPLPGSTGTWDCVRRAKTAGIPVRTITPPGGV